MDKYQVKIPADLGALLKTRDELNAGIVDLVASIAAKYSPLKVGDICQFKYGDAYRKCRVVEVRGKLDWRDSVSINYIVVILRKDGTEGDKKLIESWYNPLTPVREA